MRPAEFVAAALRVFRAMILDIGGGDAPASYQFRLPDDMFEHPPVRLDQPLLAEPRRDLIHRRSFARIRDHGFPHI